MRKIFLILVAVATMAFAQANFSHGPMLGLGVVSASGNGDEFYDAASSYGVDFKFGWNFLIPVDQFIFFHTGTDIGYSIFSGDDDNDDDYHMEFWTSELQIPLAMRCTWNDFYIELGTRVAINLGAGWNYFYDDEKIKSGSLDDLYKRYHIGILGVVGVSVNPFDVNLTTAYDLTSPTKNIGNGSTKNLSVDLDVIIWFGGKK